LLRDRATYEPYPPQSVGRATSEFVIGLKSGRAAVAKLLEQGGVVGDADAVLAQVRLESRRRRRALSSAEVFTLAREVAGRAPASS
jgi:homocitrate synthase NifV